MSAGPVIYRDDCDGKGFSIVHAPFIARRMTDPAGEIARILADGYPVGLLSGNSEFGPRALGGRCILADPRSEKMRDCLNERIKHRLWFRPYAPVVPLEKAGEYFEIAEPSPYMLRVMSIRPDRIADIAATAHADNTARVQTLENSADPFLHALLLAFEKLTGVAVLILTSFNDHGEPMVESPLDAFACFAKTDLPYLAMGETLFAKDPLPEPCRG